MQDILVRRGIVVSTGEMQMLLAHFMLPSEVEVDVMRCACAAGSAQLLCMDL